jgi:hypothetical protein
MNQHCGKHDKIFDLDMGKTCPGCDTEEEQQLNEQERPEELEEGKPARRSKK